MVKRRVLIAEDHAPTKVALSRVFSRAGWTVRTAATAAEGLAALHPTPACVLLDLMLPDGDVILDKIRDDHIRTRLVALTTAMDNPARLDEVSRRRPEVLIQKPINAAGLRRLFEELIREQATVPSGTAGVDSPLTHRLPPPRLAHCPLHGHSGIPA